MTTTKRITIRLSGDPKAASLTFDVVQESQAAIELDNGMGGPLRARFTLSKMPDGTLQNSIGLSYDIVGRTPVTSRIEPVYREDGSSDLCEVQDREDGQGGRVIRVLQPAATEPMGQAEIVLREASCALLVLIHTPAIRAFLEANDPQALRQAETASWRVSEEIKRQSTLVDSIPEAAALDVTTTLADALRACTGSVEVTVFDGETYHTSKAQEDGR